MVRESDRLSQRPGELRRRLFSDGPHMLVVWCDHVDAPLGFQLLYETGMGRFVLTQRLDGSISHNRLDEGAHMQGHSVSPVLALDGPFDADRILPAFIHRTPDLDQPIREMVIRAMRKAGAAK